MPMPFAPNPVPTVMLPVYYPVGFDLPQSPFQMEWDQTVDRWMYGIVPDAGPDVEAAMASWLTESLLPSFMMPSQYREISLADGEFRWAQPGDPIIGVAQRVRIDPALQGVPLVSPPSAPQTVQNATPVLHDADSEGGGETDPPLIADE